MTTQKENRDPIIWCFKLKEKKNSFKKLKYLNLSLNLRDQEIEPELGNKYKYSLRKELE